MPNGKGTLDCCYCKHFGGLQGYPDGAYEVAQCMFHNVELPVLDQSSLNRICCHFEANDFYHQHNSPFCPPGRRFAWFARDLQPGVLYYFCYNSPDKIEHEFQLRIPVYENESWKARDDDSADPTVKSQEPQ
jgi:hypothetical protein